MQIFVNKTQRQQGQMVSDKMVDQNKIFSFKIKCQVKNAFPSDVERGLGGGGGGGGGGRGGEGMGMLKLKRNKI